MKFPPTEDTRCGTTAGYYAHNRRGEASCTPCKEIKTSNDKSYQEKNKKAVSASKKAYYVKNKTVILAQTKIYASTHKEQVKETNKRWALKNPERKKEISRLWYRNHPEQAKEISHNWYIANAEKIAEDKQAYRAKNVEKLVKYRRAYKQSHKEEGKNLDRKRRARLAGVQSEKFTNQDVLNLYGTNCHLCQKSINLLVSGKAGSQKGWKYGLHIEHLQPISKGGLNTLENVRPSHAICNLQKGSKIVPDTL